MSNGIKYLLESSGIGTNTGVLKIYYDFENNQTYFNNGSKTGIRSMDGGAPNFTGVLEVYAHEMGQETLSEMSDLSMITGQNGVNLIGHRVDESDGICSRIQIQNASSIYSGNAFTFVVEGGKFPRDAAKDIYDYSGFNEQLPFHNKEVIFSNMAGGSGWEFGLNGANLFYFKTNDLGRARTVVYDEDRPMGENIWGVSYIGSEIKISRYDKETDSMRFSSMSLGAPLTNGGEWFINSGIDCGLESINTGSADAITSSIRLRKFMFFGDYINEENFKKVFRYSEITIETGEFISDSGIISNLTGMQEVLVLNSGILYTTGILSGVLQTVYNITGEPEYVLYSGELTDGEQGLRHCATDGIFYADIVEKDIETILTGYDTILTSSGYIVETPVYIRSGVSGVISSGVQIEYLYENEYWEETGIYRNEITGSSENLSARSFSYIGPRYDDALVELFVVSDTGKSNISARKGISSYLKGAAIFAGNLSNPSSLRLYINGVASRRGTGTPIFIDDGGIRRTSFEIENDYIITGANGEIFDNNVYTGVQESENLHGIFDILTGDIGQRIVTSLSEYDGVTTFPEIMPNGRDVFFNGVKIYEDRDFLVNFEGEFLPTGASITGSTGIYFSWPKIEGYQYDLQESVYDIYGQNQIGRNSVSVWINGIRKPIESQVYHDIYVDLISGRNLEIDTGTGVFEGN